MILEDDPTLLDLLQHLLRFEGFDVISEDSLDRAMKQIRAHHPDGLILDIQIADRNGLVLVDEIAKTINSRRPTSLPLRAWILLRKLKNGEQTTL